MRERRSSVLSEMIGVVLYVICMDLQSRGLSDEEILFDIEQSTWPTILDEIERAMDLAEDDPPE